MGVSVSSYGRFRRDTYPSRATVSGAVYERGGSVMEILGSEKACPVTSGDMAYLMTVHNNALNYLMV